MDRSFQPFPDEPSFQDPPEPQSQSRRPSVSTVGSRRASNYDAQRINRRPRPTSSNSQAADPYSSEFTSRPVSRPVSSASRGTSRTRVAHYSAGYQYHDQMPEDEYTLPTGLPPQERRASKEPERVPKHARNFSQRDPIHSHSRSASAVTREQPPPEPTALPPVPQSQSRRVSAAPSTTSKRNTLVQARESGEAKAPYRPRTADEYKEDAVPPVSPWLSHLYTVSYLILFSILGTLARLGVQWITFYPGAPVVTPVAWANFGGSLVLGFLIEDHVLFRDTSRALLSGEKPGNWEDHVDRDELNKRKKSLPLYVGLAVGFCGCFTSFSSFARDMFLSISNNLPTPVNYPFNPAPPPAFAVGRNAGYSVEALLGVVITTFALSMGGLIAGGHIATALESFIPTLPVNLTRKFLDPLSVLLGFGCWIGALLLAIFPPDRPGGPAALGDTWASEVWRGEVLFALVFAPAGCLLRFYASLQLNVLVGTFPLGTFAVNMFGTAVEGMAYDVQHVGIGLVGLLGGGQVGCQVLQGIMDGFCGSLTTVSSLVAETRALRRRHGYLYMLVTIIGGLCLMLVIMGSVRWTVGWGDPVCNTGYTSKVHAG